MPIIILVLGIAFLYFLLVKCKLNAFLSLLITCLVVGYAEGLPLTKLIASIEAGMGGTLGHLAIILGLGAMFGKIMADGGGAQRIADTLIAKFGRKHVAWAVAITGFVVGITLFWEVSFVVLIPIVFTISVAGKIPLLEVGLPMLSAITISHCFLPPHPGPVAIANIFHANIGLVLVYGIIISIPTLLVTGPLFYKLVKKAGVNTEIPSGLKVGKVFEEHELPGFLISFFTALVPVIIIIASLVIEAAFPKDSLIVTVFKFIGTTDMALLIALLVSMYSFGFAQGKNIKELMLSAEQSIKSIAMIILVIGGGGAFKQVIIDSGVGQYVASLMVGMPLSPYIVAWVITAVIRVAIGSSTVTLFTAAGLLLPLLSQPGVNPELMVIALACGSVFFDPPTDAAFWMVKEYFNFTLPQMFVIWGGLTSLIAIMGLIGVITLSFFI
ncbi:gluconate:H+ symporter [Anaerospora sp.]|uniref:gluconate:H+ symporter n=1 Tax=Anaerospora sp. TaxID=1960278 RepID=UPI00289B8958|nr:gluconate:H+ symporter [Anaerospora sp.]